MERYGVLVPVDRLDAALACGADYVEPPIVGNVVIEVDGRWVANPAFRTPAPAPQFAVLFPGTFELSRPGADLDAVASYLETALSTVAVFAEPGARVVFGSGAARRVPEDVSFAAGRARFAEVFGIAREAGRSHGLEVVLEPLHKGETNLINSLAEGAVFLDEFGFDDSRMVADLFHIVLEAEPLEVLRRLGPRIGHAHVADTGRLAPGTGDWPIAEFVEALHAAGDTGNLTVECHFDDFATELTAAFAFLRGLER